jgi:hypothetical protein
MKRAHFLFLALAALGCNRPPAKPVEVVEGTSDVSRFELKTLRGARDGDRLDVQAIYSDGTGSLTVEMHFLVTPPTKLQSGTWSGLGESGSVSQRSVTFLGGQSGPPSLGGRFDLLNAEGKPVYRIDIPLQELKNPR